MNLVNDEGLDGISEILDGLDGVGEQVDQTLPQGTDLIRNDGKSRSQSGGGLLQQIGPALGLGEEGRKRSQGHNKGTDTRGDDGRPQGLEAAREFLDATESARHLRGYAPEDSVELRKRHIARLPRFTEGLGHCVRLLFDLIGPG